ncbi:BTB and MATH domain-containing protein 36-like [Stylophora pistillata]|nr:BTB and MATH domain-containing protein 36-like [Stylophora pistillata]
MATNNGGESPDFSQPWKLSDVVLVVEEKKFHVHRAMLALWSPVFEKMFTSEFQEKEKKEIPLPDKKAVEFKEFLLHMYPSGKERAVTEENCCYLLKLAHEYQMTAIVERCEDFMVGAVKAKPNNSILEYLVTAQTYKLKNLKLASVKRSHSLCLGELKSNKTYEQIERENLKEIMEGIIERLDRELNQSQSVSATREITIDKMKGIHISVRDDGLLRVGNIARSLVRHAYGANKGIYSLINCSDTESCLEALANDHLTMSGKCTGLSETVSDLRKLKYSLEALNSDIALEAHSQCSKQKGEKASRARLF